MAALDINVQSNNNNNQHMNQDQIKIIWQKIDTSINNHNNNNSKTKPTTFSAGTGNNWTSSNQYNKSKQAKLDTHGVNNISNNEEKVNETHVEYSQEFTDDDAKFVGYSALGTAVGAYAVDLAIEQAFMSTIGAELLYAAGIGAYGGVIGVGVAVASVGIGIGINKLKQQWANQKLSKQKECNAKIELYKSELNVFKSHLSEFKILKDELIKQETILNYSNNKSDINISRLRFFQRLNGKSVMLIGPTGYGKSLIGNRLMGDVTSRVFEMSEPTYNGDFKVAEFGDTQSETSQLKPVTKHVTVSKAGEIIHDFNLTVIDTPGAFDSNGNSKYYQNEMSQFCKQIGGVNMFMIVFKFGTKMDDNYKKLLKSYETFWGVNIWKHCAIVITNCDLDSPPKQKIFKLKLPNTIAQCKQSLNKVSNGRCNNVPVLCFGENNFYDAILKSFDLLNDNNTRFANKYQCDSIRSPMDSAWEKLDAKTKECNQSLRRMTHIKHQIDSIKQEIEQL